MKNKICTLLLLFFMSGTYAQLLIGGEIHLLESTSILSYDLEGRIVFSTFSSIISFKDQPDATYVISAGYLRAKCITSHGEIIGTSLLISGDQKNTIETLNEDDTFDLFGDDVRQYKLSNTNSTKEFYLVCLNVVWPGRTTVDTLFPAKVVQHIAGGITLDPNTRIFFDRTGGTASIRSSGATTYPVTDPLSILESFQFVHDSARIYSIHNVVFGHILQRQSANVQNTMRMQLEGKSFLADTAIVFIGGQYKKCITLTSSSDSTKFVFVKYNPQNIAPTTALPPTHRIMNSIELMDSIGQLSDYGGDEHAFRVAIREKVHHFFPFVPIVDTNHYVRDLTISLDSLIRLAAENKGGVCAYFNELLARVYYELYGYPAWAISEGDSAGVIGGHVQCLVNMTNRYWVEDADGNYEYQDSLGNPLDFQQVLFLVAHHRMNEVHMSQNISLGIKISDGPALSLYMGNYVPEAHTESSQNPSCGFRQYSVRRMEDIVDDVEFLQIAHLQEYSNILTLSGGFDRTVNTFPQSLFWYRGLYSGPNQVTMNTKIRNWIAAALQP